jgi:hypothetical protein
MPLLDQERRNRHRDARQGGFLENETITVIVRDLAPPVGSEVIDAAEYIFPDSSIRMHITCRLRARPKDT